MVEVERLGWWGLREEPAGARAGDSTQIFGIGRDELPAVVGPDRGLRTGEEAELHPGTELMNVGALGGGQGVMVVIEADPRPELPLLGRRDLGLNIPRDV